MLPSVRDERTTVRAIAVSTATVPAATFAFVLTPAFHWAFIAVAAIAGGILLALTVRFVRRPSAETAWQGYRFSGVYLALILAGAIVDAILFLQ
jgi:heme O synthase-like polyprenyltransferase